MRSFRRQGAPRRFAGRRRKELEWLGLPPTALAASTTATTALSHLFGFEAPVVTVGTALSSDPPADRIIQRITGELRVKLTGSGSFTLGLLVVDRTWTPQGGTFSVDADKRILWSRTYDSAELAGNVTGFTSVSWSAPNHMLVNATTDLLTECDRGAVYIDVAPKVRLEDGKSLAIIAWENEDGATLILNMVWMRLLLSRAGRV